MNLAPHQLFDGEVEAIIIALLLVQFLVTFQTRMVFTTTYMTPSMIIVMDHHSVT